MHLYWKQGCIKTLFARKQGPARPNFLYENQSLQHCLSYDVKKNNHVFSPWGLVFPTSPPFRGSVFPSGSGSVSSSRFKQCHFAMHEWDCMLCSLFWITAVAQNYDHILMVFKKIKLIMNFFGVQYFPVFPASLNLSGIWLQTQTI